MSVNFGLEKRLEIGYNRGKTIFNMVGLAQMVRASDCGPEGRRFDPDIPPHIWN